MRRIEVEDKEIGIGCGGRFESCGVELEEERIVLEAEGVPLGIQFQFCIHADIERCAGSLGARLHRDPVGRNRHHCRATAGEGR